MYVRTAQSVTGRTLGAWCDFLGPWICAGSPTYGATSDFYDRLSPVQQEQYNRAASGAPAAPPPVPQDSSFIPGSSVSDYLMNMVTGKPTDTQIAYNTNQCVAAIQRMRAMQGAAAIPAGAENQCATDQEAYKKLIGGTADQLLANLIPGTGSAISWTAIGLLAALGFGIYLARR